nr:hypothetical protein GCM10020185_45400 [Pseudomonas brassicacearum subsp. brassicacearum]
MKLAGQADRRATFTTIQVLALAFHQIAQLLQVLGLRRPAGQAHQGLLSQAASVEDLPGLLQVWRSDLWPVVGPQDHHLLMRQARQNAANDTAADTKHIPPGFPR